MNKLLILISIVCAFSALAEACGCYGPTSCHVNGSLAGYDGKGQCDCCPVCNTCDQIFLGCIRSFSETLQFTPALPPTFTVGVPIGEYIINSTQNAGLFGVSGTCVQPALPAGLNFSTDANGNEILTGTPTEASAATSYRIVIKGSIEIIYETTVTIAVQQSNGSDSSSTSGSVAASSTSGSVAASSTSGSVAASSTSGSSTSGSAASTSTGSASSPVGASTSTGSASSPVGASTSTGSASSPVGASTSTGSASSPVGASTSTGSASPVSATTTTGTASSPVAASTSTGSVVSSPTSVNNNENDGSSASTLSAVIAISAVGVLLAM